MARATKPRPPRKAASERRPRARSKVAGRAAAAGSKARGARAARAPKSEHPHVLAGPRALWSGTITFALVSVPVDLYPASRDASVRMRLLAPDGTPLESHWFCPEHERELAWSSIDRAQETEHGFVVLSDAELEAIEPRRSRDIEIETFVPAAAIGPLMVESSFVLVPSSGPTKPYRLLARALEQKRLAGIATFVMRRRERLTAVIARDGVLWAVALRFREDVRSAAQAGLTAQAGLADVRPNAAATRKLRSAVRALARPRWSPNALRDEATEQLRALIAKKRRLEQAVVRVESEAAREREEDEGALDELGAEGQDVFELIRERMRAAPRARKRAGKARRAELRAVPKRAQSA